jgi:hypothetical protein
LSLDLVRPTHGRVVALKRHLKKVRWQLPFEGEVRGMFANGLVVLAANAFPFMDVSFWKRGELRYTRRMAPVVLGNRLEFAADRRGGLLYWVDHSGTNGPMAYVDKRDRTWFATFVPQGFPTFNFAQLTPHVLLLAELGAGGARLQTYRFKRSPVLLGETYVPFAVRGVVVGGTVYVTVQGGGTTGVRAYDKKLRRAKWENVGAGHATYPVAPKVFCRVSSNATSATYTIFKKKRTIATHTYAP